MADVDGMQEVIIGQADQVGSDERSRLDYRRSRRVTAQPAYHDAGQRGVAHTVFY